MKHTHLIHPNYRPDIDGLRAIAILSVVFFHAFPNRLSGGFIGVDIFFVISGFLISTIIFSSLERDRFSLREFYVRRIKRIFPALLLVMAASFAFGWFTLLADEYKQLGKHLIAGAAFVSNFALWGESGYFDTAAESKPLLHLWSLAIEEQFYIVWPLLMALVWKRRWNFLKVTAIIGLLSFAANIYLVNHDAVAAFYSPLSRFWELMVGGLLAWIRLHHPSLNDRHHNMQSALGLTLIIAGVLLLDKASAFPGWWALLPTLGAFFIISAGPSAWLNRELLASRPMVWTGLISYPLYLWHWPLLSFATLFGINAANEDLRLFIILLSILLAWLTYYFIERPIKSRKSSRTLIAGLIAAMLLIALVGHNVYSRDGLGFRFKAVIANLTKTDLDISKSYRQGLCFMGGESADFAAECTDKTEGKRIFLWGDSHAAALYPGLKQLQATQSLAISQYNAAACAPLLTNKQDQRCKRANDKILSILNGEQPDLIILHADWTKDSLSELGETVHQIRRGHKGKILLLGPVPHWTGGLPKLFWMYWREHHEVMPTRSRFVLDQQTGELDQDASEIAQTLGVEYFSAYNLMCTGEGCLTRAESEEITAFDSAHLTLSASTFVMKAVLKL